MSSTTLLIVTSRPESAELNEMLRGMGWRRHVRWADSLPSALKALASEKIDVAVLDGSLPDASHQKTVHALRKLKPDLPVVALASSRDETAVVATIAAEADAYLLEEFASRAIADAAVSCAVRRRRRLAHARQGLRRLKHRCRTHVTAHKRHLHFLGFASHGFRGALTIVKEYAGLLRDGLVGELNGEQRRMLEIVADRADDLNCIMDSLWMEDRLQARLLKPWRRDCALSDLVAQVRAGLEQKAHLKGIGLSIEMDAPLAPVYCDAEIVARVLVNLLADAMKSTPEGARVHVRVTEDRARHEGVIAITKGGEDIRRTLSMLARREPPQAGGEQPRHRQKLGPLLVLAKKLIDLNLGQLRYRAEPAQATTLSLAIPMAQPKEVLRRYLERVRRAGNGSSPVSLLMVKVRGEAERPGTAAVDLVLNQAARQQDLVLRVNLRTWLLVLATDRRGVDRCVNRITRLRAAVPGDPLHVPLPGMNVRRLGTWCVGQQGTHVLKQFDQAWADGAFAAPQEGLAQEAATV
ncbi:MAG: hybrid sensor histidine kinase/response regulator [Planctomycetes bacterium]|nr:hybrid sensor histidine kinase/response regulator [Planctomycetota bacterium]